MMKADVCRKIKNLVEQVKYLEDVEDMNVYKRIIYVTIYLLRCPDLDNNLYIGLYKLFDTMIYHPPWDIEMSIHDDLSTLITLCYQYRPNDTELSNVFQKDISDMPIRSLLDIWVAC